ncbi:glycosyltransferase family 2 protein [uncultured Algimonas sp.]|uniref:glycosyltransferase family 2 protein n=1 Tax=uncultured Algimonas sp. TaxID=1547920 RepID=UPI0026293109|nr:glycosyltransferase family 2 protein [uncultured Algimonas sp.]
MIPGLSIVIPTYKRPQGLAVLLDSIVSDVEGRSDIAVIVADNDRERSAEAIVERIAATAALHFEYTVAPEPGVSNARNAAMDLVRSPCVLFLDDDMEVMPGFVDAMLATSQALGASLTFAPIRAVLPQDANRLADWLAPLFSRQIDGESRLIEQVQGTGGCLFDMRGLTLPYPVFDPALNETGGEDDALFAAILRQGGRAAWCAEAQAMEHVPTHRTTLKYLWTRHFAYGQTPSRLAAGKGLFGAPAVMKWMAVGSVQSFVHGVAWLCLRLAGRPSHVGQLGRLAQGIGKVFWWDGLSPRFYGRSAR